MFARSGWRVNAPSLLEEPIPRRSEDEHPPARPRPTHRTQGATRTPTEPAQAPQAPRTDDPHPGPATEEQVPVPL
ncbi:hypothetical protein GCM10023257_29420 [Streptomyces hyderabadensis]|uniref:Uncharacterized protein n=1 Tax=Streptomyces hyderabadensis TaxID=598549 RepID=A0ABP9I4J4_9ACTN